MASWLVHSTPERAVQVRALAGDIVLCSWARHFTLTVPLSTQVYKWVPVNCWGNLTNCGEVTCDGLASCPGEVEILLAASCYRNWDKLRQLWASHGSKASLFLKNIKQFSLISGHQKYVWTGADLGGGCRGCAPLPHRWGILVFAPFLSDAPPPEKNPGSAPAGCPFG